MRIFINLIFLFLTSNASAIDYIKKNHINVGINTFYRDYREDLIMPFKSNESGVLAGIILGYEHKAPNSFLFTTDLNLSLGNTHYDGSLQDISGGYICPWESKTSNYFLNIDSQMGYTFSKSNRHLFTPFIGVGTTTWKRGVDGFFETYIWDYLSGGLQYDYNANHQYQYGLHIKVMGASGTMQISDFPASIMTLREKTHFEISTPLIYKPLIGNNYWRFTPYYQYQRFGESDSVPAAQFGPSFVIYVSEPASRTHIVGVKAEYAFGFARQK